VAAKRTTIAFGTSGWRAILADEFTFENAALVVRAIADEVKATVKDPAVVIGRDTRFLGERFALMAARILAGAGVRPLLIDRDAPTPVIAHAIIDLKAAGGINFTASHNPCEYQGIKFSPSNGGPATKEMTKSLEKRIAALQDSGETINLGEAPAERIDPRPAYLARLREIIDFKAIREAKLKILVNCLYGTSRNYLDAILREEGCQVEVMNDRPEPGFGGFPPEPAPAYVKDFTGRLEAEGFDLGLATDGDADRFGVFGRGGFAPNANEMLALILDHLATSRNWKGVVVRSVATSHFVDAVAKLHGCETREVPVGFKWIAGVMEEAPERFVIGGEESGGLTIRGHVPEKDGVLACLLAAEMVARRGQPLAAILEDLRSRAGRIASDRINIHYEPEKRAALVERVAAKPETIAGRKVVEINTMDGTKFLLEDGSWLMTRFSGTEPVVRLYIEGPVAAIKDLETAGRKMLGHA
jgi:alpha-D-glucose phosphate-specific phosphoglucomutase